MPEPKQVAALTDARGVIHDVVVQAVQNGNLVLRLSTIPIAPADDALLELTWGTPGGAKRLPVRYLTGMEAGRVAVWAVEPAGESTRHQRREYVRIEMGTPLELRLKTTTKSVRCILADVSEVALRGQVSQDLIWLLPVGEELAATFMLGTVEFSLLGQVIRTIPNESGRTTDFVMTFDQTGQDRSLLRRSVFAEQVRQRNLLADIRS